MDRPLPVLAAPPASTCVWMDAGLIAFRLCDRGYACEHCPFDAAMRRDPTASIHDEPGDDPSRPPPPWTFPADRLYTRGHLWVQVVRAGRIRTGLDACAARLLRFTQHVAFPDAGAELPAGSSLCTVVLDAGPMPLSVPMSVRLSAPNPRLINSPELAVTEPYGAGWLAELALARPSELDDLIPADEARALAESDARQFRRNLAFHLLATPPSSPDLTLAPPILSATLAAAGPEPYLAMARRFVH